MQSKIIKIVAIIGGVILAWILAFTLFGKKEDVQKIKLEFWNVFDTTETMRPLLDDFTKKTGIEVNYRSFTDLTEYRETLLFELAASEGPDVLAIHANWIPKYRNLLLPLPEEIGYSEKNVEKDFVNAVFSAVIFEEEISESDRKKGRTSEVQIFGLPMYLDTLALYYNKTFFRNVLSKAYSVPELTWDGIREDVIKLTTKDSNDVEGFKLAGIALGRADNIMRGVDIFYALYRQFGGENLAEAGKEKAKDDSDHDYKPLTAALDFITSFSRNARNKEYSWNSDMGRGAAEKEIAAFARGKVAMIAGYSYYFDSIKSLIEQGKKMDEDQINISEIGIAPFPQIHDPQAGNPKTALADFFALSVAKSSKNPLESWQLILELTENSAQQEYFKATKKSTSRRDLIKEQKKDSLFGVFAEQAVYADILPIADDKLFATVVANALNRISDGEITPSEGAKELEAVFASTTM